MNAELERRIDDLYAETPERFTAARNALAAELRAEGRREDEKLVRGLKRPSALAWAVNVAARGDRPLVTELLEAGNALRAEQQRALSGRGADKLRDATEARRETVLRLRDAAAAVVRTAGRDPRASFDELAATFEAASVDEEAGELLRAGRLERMLTPPAGLGDVAGLKVVTTGRRRSDRDDPGSPADARARERERARERARLDREVAQASKRQRDAEREVERLRGRMDRARAALEEATGALRAAEAEARGAKLEATRLANALRRAERDS